MNLNEVQVSYKPTLGPQVKSSTDAASYLQQVWDKENLLMDFQEAFVILLLNKSNHILGYKTVSIGGIAGTVVDPRIIFSIAIKSLASAVILCHNHPSGNLTPSQSDIDTTRKLLEGGKLLDIAVLDHIILTSKNGYTSLGDKGII